MVGRRQGRAGSESLYISVQTECVRRMVQESAHAKLCNFTHLRPKLISSENSPSFTHHIISFSCWMLVQQDLSVFAL